jgi:hypothetical protein
MAGAGADQDVGLVAAGARFVHLPRWQVGAVGDPDDPMIAAVGGVPILDGFLG